VNLEYLSLKDDHLTVLPKELFLLKNIRLKWNNLKVLPKEFSNLKNLGTLSLNDETEMGFVLAKLQN
jgi:hypothetical protein